MFLILNIKQLLLHQIKMKTDPWPQDPCPILALNLLRYDLIHCHTRPGTLSSCLLLKLINEFSTHVIQDWRSLFSCAETRFGTLLFIQKIYKPILQSSWDKGIANRNHEYTKTFKTEISFKSWKNCKTWLQQDYYWQALKGEKSARQKRSGTDSLTGRPRCFKFLRSPNTNPKTGPRRQLCFMD